VSWILHSCSEAYDLPWHRVLGAGGKISIPKRSKYHRLQKQLLQKEGVSFDENGHINMARFQWKKWGAIKKASHKGPKLFS
jgi:methylated-DNA-protein-cysteine methyltransferase-like protein